MAKIIQIGHSFQNLEGQAADVGLQEREDTVLRTCSALQGLGEQGAPSRKPVL
jgi:hypothetical protein